MNTKRKIRPAKTISEHNIKQRRVNNKSEQLGKALNYCRANNCTGRAAIANGICPDIKDARTINRRLNGEIEVGKEKEYCQILTCDEEIILVNFIKNKSQAFQPDRRKDCHEIIIQMLKSRNDLNEQTKGKKLSSNSRKVLETGKIGKDFWRRFEAKFLTLSNRKMVSVTSLKRISACTKEMAMQHLDSLAGELIAAGIFADPIRIEPGVWDGTIDTSRIYNHVESHQLVRCGQDGTEPEFFHCERGKEYEKDLSESQDCVTIHPFVSLDGCVAFCHVIFKEVGTTSSMVTETEKIQNLLISTTESGSQDELSLLAAYESLDRIIDKKKKPVVSFTYAHSNRFHHEILKCCREKQLGQFLCPPDATHVTQALDQINASLQHSFRSHTENLFNENGSIDRQGFIDVLENKWSSWTAKETIKRAAKEVGISSGGLNWQWMQIDKFSQSDALSVSDAVWEDDLPTMTNVRSESMEYNNKLQFEISKKQAKTLLVTEESIVTVHQKSCVEDLQNTQVTGLQGSSMETCNPLNQLVTKEKDVSICGEMTCDVEKLQHENDAGLD